MKNLIEVWGGGELYNTAMAWEYFILVLLLKIAGF